MPDSEPYYRADLSLVHHLGFGAHADACAPGIVALLEPVRARGGLVVEFGCGSGLLTRHLVDAGLRVLATDASPAMLDLARSHAQDAEGHEVVRLPTDALPAADAIVGVGHPINYLPDTDAIEAALVSMADALRTGGVLAFDVCDLEYGVARRDVDSTARVDDGWAVLVRFEWPAPDRFVRHVTTFVADDGGRWRRDDEVHANVLVDTATIPRLLADHGVHAELRAGFGDDLLPVGMRAVIGTKRG